MLKFSRVGFRKEKNINVALRSLIALLPYVTMAYCILKRWRFLVCFSTMFRIGCLVSIDL